MIRHLLTVNFVINILLITGIYLLVLVYFLNSQLIIDSLTGPLPWGLKFSLFTSLPFATWLMMDNLEKLTFLLIALLTGINLAMILHSLSSLGNLTNVHLAAGGNSLLAIVGNGCISCGLSVLSILGFSGVIVFLPFKGSELPYLAVILLSVSIYFMLKREYQSKACKLTPKQQTF